MFLTNARTLMLTIYCTYEATMLGRMLIFALFCLRCVFLCKTARKRSLLKNAVNVVGFPYLIQVPIKGGVPYQREMLFGGPSKKGSGGNQFHLS